MQYRWLDVGLTRPLHVREELVSARQDACRLLFISDIHLRNGRSDVLCRQVMDAVTGCNPDLVLLGGDLADTPSELDTLGELVCGMREVAPVFAVAGNHDCWIGVDRVRDAVVRGGGQWVNDTSASVIHGSRRIVISGPETATHLDGHVRVLCAHNPRIWKSSRDRGFDLVLAGHLHGCQLVACEYRDRLFPGALLYPHCFMRARFGSTRLVVSRGVSDLIPIRWRCPREVVLCHV